jgi:hypothetical protein
MDDDVRSSGAIRVNPQRDWSFGASPGPCTIYIHALGRRLRFQVFSTNFAGRGRRRGVKNVWQDKDEISS